MDYTTKLARRKEYNRIKLALQRKQREALRQFAAENPERHKELVSKVHAEMNAEDAIYPTFQGRSIKEQINSSRQQEAENHVYALIKQIHAGKRDWIITAKDTYGDTHTLFLGFPKEHVPQAGDKVKTPIKGTEYTVVDATPCTCPLCT